MAAVERRFTVNGYQLAAKEWHSGAPNKVLACHGWLDNASSFDALCPLLESCHIIALDMPGHGLSDHKPVQAQYNIWDDLLDILAVADAMEWQSFHLLGHSRGAIMSLLLATAMPKRISSLVMLDALLPLPIKIEDTVKQLNRFLTQQRSAHKKKLPAYKTVDAAVASRCRASGMPEQAAMPIVERGLKVVAEGYRWRCDSRLTTASAFKLTDAHNQLIIESLKVPALAILAKQGFGSLKDMVAMAENCEAIECHLIEGKHHFHMEGAVQEIAVLLVEFLNRNKRVQ